jgi:hypothetical protein
MERRHEVLPQRLGADAAGDEDRAGRPIGVHHIALAGRRSDLAHGLAVVQYQRSIGFAPEDSGAHETDRVARFLREPTLLLSRHPQRRLVHRLHAVTGGPGGTWAMTPATARRCGKRGDRTVAVGVAIGDPELECLTIG